MSSGFDRAAAVFVPCNTSDQYTWPNLMGAAARHRGLLAMTRDAWEEALEKVGPMIAAAAFVVVLELYDRDQRHPQSWWLFPRLCAQDSRARD